MPERNLNRRKFISLLAAIPAGAALLSACGDGIDTVEKLQTDAGGALILPQKGVAPEFDNQTWINSEPLRLTQLRGKVVLVDFWTFDCINCQHVIPSLRDWYSEFSNKGLVIVGMHAPEFDYEKKLENVRDAVKRYDIKYAVAQDNDFKTWNKYQVRAWPTLFLIDKQANIRYNYIGEGNYDGTHAAIQTLLSE
jgi:thiol-disulfide isomerase/thioredoxin